MRPALMMVLLCVTCLCVSAASVFDLRCESLSHPICIDTPTPRFSWKWRADGYGRRQTAYRLVVETVDEAHTVWDSGRVESDIQLWIAYAGTSLRSNTPYRWKVQVWDENNKTDGWSAPAIFQTALLMQEEWKARWIRVPYERYVGHPLFKEYKRLLGVKNTPAHTWVPSGAEIETWMAAGVQKQMNAIPDDLAPAFQRDRLEELLPAPLFRRTFKVRPGLQRAILHYCGLGLVEFSVNGARIGDHTWDPAFTDYDKRAMYLTADITSQLTPGENALGAQVGDGWFGQSLGFSNLTKTWRYGDPGLIAQLELFYADGQRDQLITDGAWQCTLEGPVVKNGVWCGELFDARRNISGWDRAHFQPDSRWISAVETTPLSPVLQAQTVPAIREVETTAVKQWTQPKPGVWVADLGRILTGYCELQVTAPKSGDLILLVFGQSLNPDGTVSTQPGTSCGSWPVDGYICRGEPREAWKPRFTFHAFRYVQVTGLRAAPAQDALVGKFTSTDLPRISSFECSIPLFNDLHHALLRTTQGNMRHMYTDTPSRERTGWLTWPNPLSIFDNFDGYAYWQKTMGDLRTGAKRDRVDSHIGHWAKGAVVKFDSGRQVEWMENVGPGMAPGPRGSNIPEQRTSNVLYPWESYVRYGDTNLLRSNYTVMKGTIDYIAASRIDGLVPSLVGDWHDAVKADLNIAYRRERGLERDDTWGAIMGGYPVHTPGRVCGTVHLWLAAEALSKAANVLGLRDDAVRYQNLANELRDAFNRAYFHAADGRYFYTTPQGNTHESQTMYGYALYHGLAPVSQRAQTARCFLEHIAAYNGHFTSGQLGADRVLKALTISGAEQTAFDIMTVRGFPGFDHMLSFGTETTWETWGEAILNNTPAGSKHIIRASRPQEHCQWTAVDSWFFECILGLTPNPAHPAYKRFTLKPHMYRQMRWARGFYDAPYGRIQSDWRCENDRFEWTVRVPPNTTADLYVPANETPVEVHEGAAGIIQQNPPAQGRHHIVVGAGLYRFRSQIEK